MTLVVVAAVVAVLGLPGATWGDVDPASAVIAMVALAVAVWAGRQAIRAQRYTDIDVNAWSGWLAGVVLEAETRARHQMLGRADKTIDVDFVFRPAPAYDADDARAEGSLREVVAYYRRLRPRRLVITGAPGAGKTVMAVELMLGLLAGRHPDDPVPVRLSAASWDPGIRVQDWLTGHLARTYQMAPPTAAALVAAGRVLPVVDGLDEMDADPEPGYISRAARALLALNDYQRGQQKAEAVLTCRTGQYDALIRREVWAENAARVEITPLSADKALTFMESRVGGNQNMDRWRDVLDAIDFRPEAPLARALDSPWRLTMAITVYEQRDSATGRHLRDPAELAGPALDDPDKIRDHLLALYIPAVTTPRGDAVGPYRPEKVHAWLAVLATYLDTNAGTGRTIGGRTLSSTDLVLHELWPLAGNRPRVLTMALTAVLWAAVGVAMIPLGMLDLSDPYLELIFIAVGVFMCISAWGPNWPEPARLSPSRWPAGGDGRRLVAGLRGGLLTGLVAWLTVGFTLWPALGIAAGVVTALTVGLAVGLTAPAAVSATGPRDVVRSDLEVGLTAGLVFGFMAGLAVGFWSGLGGGTALLDIAYGMAVGLAVNFAGGVTFGLAAGLAGGGLTFGVAAGLAGTRYLALLLCTRGRLPLRLGRFLQWCHDAGLIRTAGIAYQFRHRELQDHLARHPVPRPLQPADAAPG
ncbi:NACHT domain-containing protein [Nonomuraea sp. SBT364]|uniref:NACHT domain-containing protein n=1 Tax=Nonomuraea sp. SBT364 TaxID=1580530 RepID=UPI00066EBB3A|nr:NACHT domain-containing protein [Nonomuraea sp. SBT364]